MTSEVYGVALRSNEQNFTKWLSSTDCHEWLKRSVAREAIERVGRVNRTCIILPRNAHSQLTENINTCRRSPFVSQPLAIIPKIRTNR